MKLSVEARAVLDKIASGESHSYSDLFGGKQFRSFRDHPGVQVPIPGSNLVSTAAGRYQLLHSTWEEQKTKLGLRDFSPHSQDLAAWDLAHRTYQQQTGRDLAADARAGMVNWGALSNQWPSLKGPVRAQAAAAGPQATGLPATLAPIPGNLLEMEVPSAEDSGLALQALQSLTQHKLHPVEHNPFQPSPYLAPIEHDPFLVEEASK